MHSREGNNELSDLNMHTRFARIMVPPEVHFKLLDIIFSEQLSNMNPQKYIRLNRIVRVIAQGRARVAATRGRETENVRLNPLV